MPKEVQYTPWQNVYFKPNPQIDAKTALVKRSKTMSNVNVHDNIFIY